MQRAGRMAGPLAFVACAEVSSGPACSMAAPVTNTSFTWMPPRCMEGRPVRLIGRNRAHLSRAEANGGRWWSGGVTGVFHETIERRQGQHEAAERWRKGKGAAPAPAGACSPTFRPRNISLPSVHKSAKNRNFTGEPIKFRNHGSQVLCMPPLRQCDRLRGT